MQEVEEEGGDLELDFSINQISIFSWREGRLSSNVNTACRREGGRAST